MGRIATSQDNSTNKQQKQIVLLILLAGTAVFLCVRQFAGGGPTPAAAAKIVDSSTEILEDSNSLQSRKLPPLDIENHLLLQGDPFNIDKTKFKQSTGREIVVVKQAVEPTKPMKVLTPEEIRKTFKLHAVFGNEIQRALINGKLFVVGDRLTHDAIIERIEPRQITLRLHDQLITIKLDKE